MFIQDEENLTISTSARFASFTASLLRRLPEEALTSRFIAKDCVRELSNPRPLSMDRGMPMLISSYAGGQRDRSPLCGHTKKLASICCSSRDPNLKIIFSCWQEEL